MLNLLKNGKPIHQVVPQGVLQVDGIYVSPALAGWEYGDYALVAAPVVPLPEMTPEERRAQMPVLSRRQFWLGADSLGVSKANVLAAATDNQIRIEIEESTDFYRTYESVVLLSPVFGITPEQLDDVWLWWASV